MVDVTLVAPPDDGSDGIGTYTGDLIDSYPETVGTQYVTVPVGDRNPLPYLSAALRAGRGDTDVIHVQHEYAIFGPNSIYSWPFLLLVVLLGRLRGIEVVLTLHSAWNAETVRGESLEPLKRLYVWANNRMLVAVASTLVFLSENCREAFRESVACENYEGFRHGVKTDAVHDIDPDEAKETFGYDPDEFLIVEPGYVREQKGVHRFVDAAEQCPDLTFLVAGGPQDEASETYASDLRDRAPSNVQFTGRLGEERFHAAFVAADVVFLPYLRMTQSGIFNWCMAYGTPVAASDHDYFERLAERWGCVELFDPDDVNDIVDTLQHLVTSDERRDELTRRAKAFADEHSFTAMGDRHAALYRRLA